MDPFGKGKEQNSNPMKVEAGLERLFSKCVNYIKH